MHVYLDTSALLRAEIELDLVLREALGRATQRYACRLLHVETARALQRLKQDGRHSKLLLSAASRIADVLATSQVVQLSEALLVSAEQEFPVEPVRSLDAIHLAAALLWRERLSAQSLGPLVFASTDDRVRANASALGFPLIPA